VIAYASATRTRRNLCALNSAGWRMLISAAAPQNYLPGWRYALDNGAWSAFQNGTAFDELAFKSAVGAMGAGADWVIAPDVVCGGLESLAYSLEWLDWTCARSRRVLIAVQDGMTPADLAPFVGRDVGIAIGGSTEWKEEQLARGGWGDLTRPRGAWLHCLRVNTARRIAMCASAGVDSFDGSSATRWADNINRLDTARCQPSLLREVAHA
jgi:hypothetical protein